MKPETIVWGAAVASAAAAWFGLLLSAISLSTSRKAVRITERQEERRRPLLVADLLQGHYQTTPDGDARVYMFQIAVSNRSDSNNAIARVELRITHNLRGSVDATLKLPADAPHRRDAAALAGDSLAIPSAIGAHQTISGWCSFRAERSILERPDRIRRYEIAIVDSDGNETMVEPIIVREYRSEMATSEMEPSRKMDHPEGALRGQAGSDRC
jgi:hypothetical protein